ncbi:MAG: DUF3160 domain-containing protein [Patescibacteria group bacterium]|jgi:hypothetical protein
MSKNIFGESEHQNIQNNTYPQNTYPSGKNSFESNNKKGLLLVIISLIIASILISVFVFLFLKNKNKEQAAQPASTDQNLEVKTLPANQLNPEDINNFDQEINNVKAETLSFDQFYQKIEDKINFNYSKLKLPLQVKTDVANYYDVSRKLEFNDVNLNEINANGFTTIDNQISTKDNFYDTYIALIGQGIPQLVTSDFLIYYYQNLLKEIFADVKSNTFFNDLWLINKSFFDIANSRYKTTALKVKIENDPVLEGQRLEAAYFATTLELLRVKEGQIINPKEPDENKFSEKEAGIYDFNLPDYLNDDVKKEVELIYQAKENAKSPVFRYYQDYALYKVPKDLQYNDRLKNFYLANKWVNSIFPLYYRDAKCPDCFLDKNDWLINLVANSYIAKDFSNNQDLKNRWARVYKVLSFFSGLRKDLTYLQFNDVLSSLHGADYKIENIFSIEKGLDNALANALKIQSEVEKKFNFSEIEGGYNRNDIAVRPQIGMRLLQQDYWPDNYIFNQLITPNVGTYKKQFVDLRENNVTGCRLGKQKIFSRCKPIGLDIINLYVPITNNDYFKENTYYDKYTTQSKKLSDQLKTFTSGSWHNSNYWSIMYLNQQSLLKSDGLDGPLYTLSSAWQQKNLNTAMSAWINLKLPNDKIILNVQQGNNLTVSNETETFVEPNLVLINELISNINMLSQMLNELRIVKDIDVTLKKISDAMDDFNAIKSLAVKELQGETLDKDSQLIVQNILKRYTVTESPDKNVIFNFGKLKTIESINGIKLQAAVYQQKDKKVLLVGPIFNYVEK